MPRKIYIVPFVVLLLAAIGSYFAFRQDDQRRRTLTTEAVANVTKTEVRRAADPIDGKEGSIDIVVTFEYEINGQKYERTVRKSKAEALPFVPWGKAKVCYDPENINTITEGELFPTSFICGAN